jgi:hypothetical protein
MTTSPYGGTNWLGYCDECERRLTPGEDSGHAWCRACRNADDDRLTRLTEGRARA